MYKDLIQFIISSINETLVFDSAKMQDNTKNISILDIAGFGMCNNRNNLVSSVCYLTELIKFASLW